MARQISMENSTQNKFQLPYNLRTMKPLFYEYISRLRCHQNVQLYDTLMSKCTLTIFMQAAVKPAWLILGVRKFELLLAAPNVVKEVKNNKTNKISKNP